jgi:EpsI family protein
MAALLPDRLLFLVPVLVIVQAVTVPWIAGTERVPRPPDFSHLASDFGGFHQIREDPIEPEVAAQLGADRTLNRIYLESASGTAVSVFVAWFQTQRGGARQPHSPKVCLPGAGWIPQGAGEIRLATAAGEIGVNRYEVVKGAERAVVLYWYQTPRRVIAGEWAAKFWLAADALRDKRTDTALVRVLAWGNGNSSGPADAAATACARALYPILKRQLPSL